MRGTKMAAGDGRVESMTDDEQVREMLNDPDGYFEAARKRAEVYAKDYAKRLREQRSVKPAAAAS